jgi:sugar phosphate isomerase/epimerase
MHEKLAVNALCFGGVGLAEQESLWRTIAPKRISFITRDVFAAGETAGKTIVASGRYQVATNSHAFHLGPLAGTEKGWTKPRAELSRAIRFASSVNAESIYMITGGRGSRSWEEAAELFSAAVRPCVAEAREANIPLLIETAPFYHSGIHLASSLRDTIQLAQMANLGVCIDLFSVWTEAGLRELIERALPLTRLVQVSDYVCGDASFPARAVPGDGDIPLKRILEWIVRGGYRQSFDFELIGPRIAAEGPVNAIRRAAEYVGDVLDSLAA